MKPNCLHRLLLCFLLLPALQVAAQSGPYGNEWIDYSKTYYKFKVGKAGVCRIFRSALNGAGLPSSVVGSNFMLFRDGQEVPVFVSAESMSGNDYIEFWGDKGNGMLDRELYLDADQQPSDRVSLFIDTATYFLTYDGGSNHLRYAGMSNAIPATPPAPSAYCLATSGFYTHTTYMPGPSYAGSYDLLSPSFDDGEGFVDAAVPVTQQPSVTIATPNVVSGYNATLHTSIVVRSFDNFHRVKLNFNSTQVADSTFPKITGTKQYHLQVPSSSLSGSNTIQLNAVPQGLSGDYDVYGFAFAELEYQRNFNLSGQDQAALKLPATGAAQYVEFTGMSAGRLYDITNRKWYNGNTGVSGKLRFYLDPSSVTRDIVLLSDAATGVTSLTPLKSMRFTDWGQAGAQGDFVVISHANFMQQVGGRNYVQEYANYRSSTAGGGHQVATADVTELYDQFAYGYDLHPLSIKHFLKYAYDRWTRKPKDVLLIGRGLQYQQYPTYRSNPTAYPFPIVPVWGVPGSDVDFVILGNDHSPKMHIGRLSVWTAPEIGVYLNKVQNSEPLLSTSAAPTAATEVWKKRALHIAGATSASAQEPLVQTLLRAGKILADTFTGMHVTDIAKSANAAIAMVNSATVDSLLRSGVSMLTFYGHASPTYFEFNLPKPEDYSNNWRMPSFLAMGCDVAQMFELQNQKTIGERYILAPTGGATTFVSSSNTAFTDFCDFYILGYYHSVAFNNYGGSVGTHYNFAHDSLTRGYILGQNYPNNYSVQLECTILEGDPSISMPAPALPDYHVAEEGLAALPANVSTSLDSFSLRVTAYNLGKALPDTVDVKVEHVNPVGAVSMVSTYKVINLHFTDTALIKVPIDKAVDLGLNKYRVTVDPANRYTEASELNNVATLEVFIASDNLVPVMPKEFSIVYSPDLTLKASTLNPFRQMSSYRIEIDTTELFNSPLKQSTSINSLGGVISWKPSITYADSTVYYWRTAFDSAINGKLLWTTSSFTYLEKGSEGWNQAHYYQYAKDASAGIVLNPARKFNFSSVTNQLKVMNIVLCNDPVSNSCNLDVAHMGDIWNGTQINKSSFSGVLNGLQITVIDSSTGRIWLNTPTTTFGATPPLSYRAGTFSRQFDVQTDAGRDSAANFLTNVVPDGSYVIVKNAFWHGYASSNYFIDKWKADSVRTGPGKTLYNALYNLGFTKIDSFYKERVFIFMRRKADPSLPVYQAVTDSPSQWLEPTFDIKGSDLSGQWASTVIGPAKEWGAFKWKTYSADAFPQNDSASVAIIGIDKNGNETTLFQNVTGDMSLATVSAQQYPKMKLIWTAKDSATLTSPQLGYWRVLYTPVPEAALNPAAHLVFSDTLSQGQMQTFSTAIENLSRQDMDSLLVRYKVIGADGVTRQLADVRYRPLKALDTIHAAITFDPAIYPGKNLFFVEANPADDQPEQYHPNNLGYLHFRIGVDNRNPMLDVTFDGQHILNGDIISARPFIKIRLKDENVHLALNDTSLMKVSLRYPSDSFSADAHPVPFDGKLCRFIPATKTEPVNEAYIEYRPELIEDGLYQLTVTGIDRTGNGAGTVYGANAAPEYKISFVVDNKPSITNVLNYPNPFSTSTAFVFTLTGSQIPQQFKIQIMTVTGRVVREVTRAELGALHIGRNITDYKWDGRDQFGQLLGNGVYLYRVVTNLNGQDMDMRTDTRDMTRNGGGIDKYFKNGWGKMYIMR